MICYCLPLQMEVKIVHFKLSDDTGSWQSYFFIWPLEVYLKKIQGTYLVLLQVSESFTSKYLLRIGKYM